MEGPSNWSVSDLKNCANAYKGKRILITGAGGFIGSNLLSVLSSVPCEILALSRRPLKRFTGCEARIIYQMPDYENSEFWQRVLHPIDIVFHLAAQTSVLTAAKNICEDARINVWPLLTMLQVCSFSGFKPAIIFAGTATQVGAPLSAPADETVPSGPLTIYDLHKQMAEDYLKFFARQGNVRGVSLRLPNVYGPGSASSSQDRGILNRIILQALRGEPLMVYGEGEGVRDYLYIDDAVSAFLAAGIKADSLTCGHFMIGSGKGISIKDTFLLVSERVRLLTGKKVAVKQSPEAPMSVLEKRIYVADNRFFSKLTGWLPQMTLEQGIDRAIAVWLKKI